MAQVRISLPGYPADTDTNLDHYSLYADIDNVLIKRKLTGTQLIADPVYPANDTDYAVAHNLTYIPFFMTYYDQSINNSNQWAILNNTYNPFQAPQQIAAADTTNLHIMNFGGHATNNVNTAYDVFYDDMSLVGSPSITESNAYIKFSRPGKNALTSTNPNDYIMHSDLNNFKILKQGNASINVAAGKNTYSFAHGFIGNPPYKFFCFIKMPDGKTLLVGGASQHSYDVSTKWIGGYMDATNIYISATWGAAATISVYYLIYGTGKAGMLTPGSAYLAVTPPGFNAETETNPDNYNFHSDYPTLKYFDESSYSMTVSNTTVQVIPHNLGYTPFFMTFINDISGNTLVPGGYNIVPFYWGRSTMSTSNNDIAAFAYADATNLYLKAWYDTNAVGTTATFNYYYKIFKNNLGL